MKLYVIDDPSEKKKIYNLYQKELRNLLFSLVSINKRILFFDSHVRCCYLTLLFVRDFLNLKYTLKRIPKYKLIIIIHTIKDTTVRTSFIKKGLLRMSFSTLKGSALPSCGHEFQRDVIPLFTGQIYMYFAKLRRTFLCF